MRTVLHTRSNARFVHIQDGSRSKERDLTFLEAALSMDCIYGFQSMDPVKVKTSNSTPFIYTCIKKGSIWRLKEGSFVLVTLNVTSHLSLHSQYYKCLTQVPQLIPLSQKNKPDLARLDREWCHLHISLFLIELHRDDH